MSNPLLLQLMEVMIIRNFYPVVVTHFNCITSSVESDLLSMLVVEGESTGNNIGKRIIDNLVAKLTLTENCISLGCSWLGRKMI